MFNLEYRTVKNFAAVGGLLGALIGFNIDAGTNPQDAATAGFIMGSYWGAHFGLGKSQLDKYLIRQQK